MDKIIHFESQPDHISTRYINFRLQPPDNNDRYEGYMRSDFSAKPRAKYDAVELIEQLEDGTYAVLTRYSYVTNTFETF